MSADQRQLVFRQIWMQFDVVTIEQANREFGTLIFADSYE